jgi:hypothetical protein
MTPYEELHMFADAVCAALKLHGIQATIDDRFKRAEYMSIAIGETRWSLIRKISDTPTYVAKQMADEYRKKIRSNHAIMFGAFSIA